MDGLTGEADDLNPAEVLLAEAALTGEVFFSGEAELLKPAEEEALGGVIGLGAGVAGLRKSAHSE